MDEDQLPSFLTDSNDLPGPEPEASGAQVRSLRELIDLASGKNLPKPQAAEDAGLAEVLPFPFMAVVGQPEMKLALLLVLINPAIGGLLLIGPRGTGKTTAVRSVSDLLPEIRRSACYYGCTEEDVESGGLDAICPDCAQKYGQGLPLTKSDRVHLVELPLNSRLEDVIGGLDDRALVHERLRLKRGIISQADQNILYIDEVNLLSDEIIDCTLDAASQGCFTVRRGPISATYNARFSLIGSMNPEEGMLRPQIMDRFGLRVLVRGLADAAERQAVYERVSAYRKNPWQLIAQFAAPTEAARREIQAARDLLPQVELPEPVLKAGIDLVQDLKIDSSRAELSLFEAARAYAAADNRSLVTTRDLAAVAPLALRLRYSAFIAHYFEERAQEENELASRIQASLDKKTT